MRKREGDKVCGMEKIVKILSIRDTRQYEEIGDKWVPIPGSGHENNCHRCGRSHEVWATVQLSNGQEAIVGTGCAGKDDAEAAARFTSLDRAAKRLASLRAEWVAFNEGLTAYENVLVEVRRNQPELSIGERTFVTGKPFKAVFCGEAYAICHGEVTHERRECAIHGWEHSEMVKRGFATYPRASRSFERDIQKTEKRIAALIA